MVLQNYWKSSIRSQEIWLDIGVHGWGSNTLPSWGEDSLKKHQNVLFLPNHINPSGQTLSTQTLHSLRILSKLCEFIQCIVHTMKWQHSKSTTTKMVGATWREVILWIHLVAFIFSLDILSYVGVMGVIFGHNKDTSRLGYNMLRTSIRNWVTM